MIKGKEDETTPSTFSEDILVLGYDANNSLFYLAAMIYFLFLYTKFQKKMEKKEKVGAKSGGKGGKEDEK
jgi:hypothetical protein